MISPKYVNILTQRKSFRIALDIENHLGLLYTTFNGRTELTDRQFYYDESGFSYTLVATEPEPVPEPLTAGGTALALAGLSWLKHKKKMAA